jgi:hypothetical protein
MNVDDLKPGDVLLFSGEKGSLISEAIMLLTGAPVSHAALAFRDPRKIVEETPPAVAVHGAEARFQGRTIYVNRLESKPDDLTPVLDAAQAYVNSEEPYAMSNLYLVGLLLLYRCFTPNTLTKQVMIRILKTLTAKILDYMHERRTPGKHPMVCSQFVYQCFEDAGGPYCLDLRQPLLRSAPLSAKEGSAPVADEESTLDRVLRHVEERGGAELAKQVCQVVAAPRTGATDGSEDELITELYAALRSEDTTDGVDPEDDLVGAVGAFAEAVFEAQAGSGSGVAGVGANEERSVAALHYMRAAQAEFVTPGDLLDRCKNLKRVGVIAN